MARKLWRVHLEVACDSSTQQERRILSLDLFVRDNLFNDVLVKALRDNLASLAPTFVQKVFSSSTSSGPAVRPLLKTDLILQRLDQQLVESSLSIQQLQQDQRLVECLSLLLECAYQTESNRHSYDITTSNALANFSDRFEGSSLSLLAAHIVVHNNLFDQEQGAPGDVHFEQQTSSQDTPATPAMNPSAAAKPLLVDDDMEFPQKNAEPWVRKQYYSKVLPILQSSGFGKTRMCVQLSTISPGMLVCLRDT